MSTPTYTVDEIFKKMFGFGLFNQEPESINKDVPNEMRTQEDAHRDWEENEYRYYKEWEIGERGETHEDE